MACNCPQLDKINGKSGFQDRCAEYVFKTHYSTWDGRIGKHLDHINSINDPILKYISVYFVQYYLDGYDYYKNSNKPDRDAACQYLKKWLQKQRDLFTYGEKCKTRDQLWETNFSTLWKELKSEYRIPENTKTDPWCDYYKFVTISEFSNGVTLPLSCHEGISQVSSSADAPPQPIAADCICPQTVNLVNVEQTDRPPAADRTKNLAVTSGFTAAGTLGTLFFLYRFTPMMSWFRRPGMNNIGTDLYMNQGAESFLGMQHGNDSNNLFYQP